jgi:anti-anti-sigma factor
MRTAPQLDACLNQPRGDTVVDCSGLDFIESTGIRAFVLANREFGARGDRLTLRNLPALVRRVLEVAGVRAILEISLRAAIPSACGSSLRMGAPPLELSGDDYPVNRGVTTMSVGGQLSVSGS